MRVAVEVGHDERFGPIASCNDLVIRREVALAVTEQHNDSIGCTSDVDRDGEVNAAVAVEVPRDEGRRPAWQLFSANLFKRAVAFTKENGHAGRSIRVIGNGQV